MERQERLLRLKELIQTHKESEYGFDMLYKQLLNEYSIEESREPDFHKNQYLNNLRQTRDKEAAEYIAAKRKGLKKGAYGEYVDFTSDFLQDVIEALRDFSTD